MLDAHERSIIESTLKRFAARIEQVLFATDGADGDLDRLPELLDEARELDLVADPAPGAPGYELGIWGALCLSEGLDLSLLALTHLGEACAGLATAIHAQGLACLALSHAAPERVGLPLEPGASAGHRQRPHPFPAGSLLAAAFMPHYGLPLREEGSGLRLVEADGRFRLEGTSHFLLAAGPPQGLVCFARRAAGDWVLLGLPVDMPGIDQMDVGRRTGLRAACQVHLHCQEVDVSPEQVLLVGEEAQLALHRVLACDWLGQSAIALGVARRSLRDSRAYTAERYQGGRLIEKHPAVRLLQGTAEYHIALLQAVLDQHVHCPLASLDPAGLLRWALVARLAVVEHAHRAVTDCLQTLGGYGYMEDYRLEKRLRDVSTLKSLHGPPDQLRLLLNDLARGGQP
jgi:alkylation response protein AidB-like acyl-CoA dehydrogenase